VLKVTPFQAWAERPGGVIVPSSNIPVINVIAKINESKT
jgi:hypothetical protein